MKKYDKLITNAVGRIVPEEINGEHHVAFQGVGKYSAYSYLRRLSS